MERWGQRSQYSLLPTTSLKSCFPQPKNPVQVYYHSKCKNLKVRTVLVLLSYYTAVERRWKSFNRRAIGRKRAWPTPTAINRTTSSSLHRSRRRVVLVLPFQGITGVADPIYGPYSACSEVAILNQKHGASYHSSTPVHTTAKTEKY